MMFGVTASSVALLAALTAAKECHNFTVPVDLTSRNGVFGNIETPMSALDATTFIQNQTRQGGNLTEMALSGYNTIQGSYNISAKFCQPSGSNGTLKDPTVQVLTHGIGFDKTYWDLSYNGYNYSYINTAVDNYGYCTLSIDRLGIGLSSHGEPRDEIQAFLEIEALAALTRMLRAGKLPTVNHAFSRVVHVGHSFGSAQTYGLTAMYPDLSDGIILTGFSLNGSFVGYFGAGGDFQQAELNQPLRFGSSQTRMTLEKIIQDYALTNYVAQPDAMAGEPLAYPRGYLTHSNVNALQYLFLLPGSFDEQIAYVGEATKQPVTVGELLTLSSAPMMNPFKGPVMVITGSNDLPYCGGDCLATGGSGDSIPAAAKMAFADAKDFTAYIQPSSGHGINFHYNATGAYNVIQTYLNSMDLMSR